MRYLLVLLLVGCASVTNYNDVDRCERVYAPQVERIYKQYVVKGVDIRDAVVQELIEMQETLSSPLGSVIVDGIGFAYTVGPNRPEELKQLYTSYCKWRLNETNK